MTLMQTNQPTSPSLLSSFYFTFSLHSLLNQKVVGMFYFYHVCPCDTHTTLSGIRRISPLHSIPYTCGPVGYEVRHILHHRSHEYACLIQFLVHQSHTQIFGKGKKKAKEKSKRLSRLQHGLFNHNSLCTLFITKTTKTILRHIVISFHSHPPTHSTQNLSFTVTLSIFKANSNLQILSDKKLYICN